MIHFVTLLMKVSLVFHSMIYLLTFFFFMCGREGKLLGPEHGANVKAHLCQANSLPLSHASFPCKSPSKGIKQKVETIRVQSSTADIEKAESSVRP